MPSVAVRDTPLEMRIEIDRSVRLDHGAANGHNRWHPEIPPAAAVDPGEEVVFELRDARDGTLGPGTPHERLLTAPSLAHPLTGPLEVRGAEPGDVLEVQILGYETDDHGWTGIWPGSGFLGDLFPEPFLVQWRLEDGVARSEQLPGVAVREGVFAGVIGVAPSHELFERALARELELAEAGAEVGLPDAETAAPPVAAEGLRTFPPRENGGNMDIRDLVAGSRLLLPVHEPGAMLSIGDLHFAQGDGEVCISAIETSGTATVRVGLRRDGWRPTFPCWETPARPGRRYFATTGVPVADDGRAADMDLNLATRRALIEMLDYLQGERGLEREPAYVLMSAAVELRLSEVVDKPNPLVSALLPLDVFEE
jgi:formamidase